MSPVDTFSPFPSSTAHTLSPSVRGLRLGQHSPALSKDSSGRKGMGCPRGLVLGGAQSRVGAGTGLACRTGQRVRRQLVLVGRAESSGGLSSPACGGV